MKSEITLQIIILFLTDLLRAFLIKLKDFKDVPKHCAFSHSILFNSNLTIEICTVRAECVFSSFGA